MKAEEYYEGTFDCPTCKGDVKVDIPNIQHFVDKAIQQEREKLKEEREFIKWYSGMSEDKIERARKRFKRELKSNQE